ncbi:MAG TPA: DUF3370 family protein [Candidatus Obscuribacterales bacterium]
MKTAYWPGTLLISASLLQSGLGQVLAEDASPSPMPTSSSVAPSPSPAQQQIKQTLRLFPLPGQLDSLPMFNDNSPESVKQSGILLSTLPNRGKVDSPFLDYGFQGDFGVFSHHILIDEIPGKRLLYLGLIASNYSAKPVTLTLRQGSSYLTQPDAAFIYTLPAVAPNPGATIFSGPGDRLSSEWIIGRMRFKDQVFTIAPGSSQILSSLPINTDVPNLSPRPGGGAPLAVNGRSTLMHFQADQPIYLSQLAWMAKRENGAPDGAFVPPGLDDYRSLINAGKFANPREPFSDYDEQHPPKGSFRYGRVAGISPGLNWKGSFWEGPRQQEMPGPGETIGYPIATTYVKRFGTGQNQSGRMIRRYKDSPPENHGNYCLRYALDLPLANQSAMPQTYQLSLTQPLNGNLATGKNELIYQEPPNGTRMFRGSVRVQWTDAQHQLQDHLIHLDLRNGQLAPALLSITVPPKASYAVKLSLIYPPDATPPQLLTIRRES